jgi:hypothetical protein
MLVPTFTKDHTHRPWNQREYITKQVFDNWRAKGHVAAEILADDALEPIFREFSEVGYMRVEGTADAAEKIVFKTRGSAINRQRTVRIKGGSVPNEKLAAAMRAIIDLYHQDNEEVQAGREARKEARQLLGAELRNVDNKYVREANVNKDGTVYLQLTDLPFELGHEIACLLREHLA